MPDIILARPAAGQQAAIPAQAQSRIVLDFAPDDATLFRQGDNLVFGFADGGSVSLTDFYKVVTKETLPEFSVDGASVPGEEFFAALNDEDLIPAAGPAANATGGGRYQDYADSALEGGTWRLGALDYRTAFGSEPRVWGKADRPCRTIAILGGSLGDFGELAIAAGADVIVTGEAGYHVAQDLALRGLPVILLGHDRSEEPFVDILMNSAVDAGVDPRHAIKILNPCQWWTVTKGENL